MHKEKTSAQSLLNCQFTALYTRVTAHKEKISAQRLLKALQHWKISLVLFLRYADLRLIIHENLAKYYE
jgi:hypothetical protein